MRKRLPIKQMLTIGLLPSCLKKLVYRIKGYRFGKGVHLSFGCVINVAGKVYIGDHSKIGFFTAISAASLTIGKRTQIRTMVLISANNITIGDDVTISEQAIIRAGHLSESSNLRIDNYVHIFPFTNIDPSRNIHLMEECAVGPKCDIFTHGSYKNIFEGYPVSYGDVTIGKRVELTYNVFVAPGVTIGDDAIIAYGSYVNKDIPAGVLAAGTPAKVKREKEQLVANYSPDEKQNILKMILQEFGKYLVYSKIVDNYELNHNCLSLYTKKKASVVSFKGLRLTYGNSFFDIDTLECTNPNTEIEKELYRFFSRYGVRFRINN